jgi:hypothetical protein
MKCFLMKVVKLNYRRGTCAFFGNLARAINQRLNYKNMYSKLELCETLRQALLGNTFFARSIDKPHLSTKLNTKLQKH